MEGGHDVQPFLHPSMLSFTNNAGNCGTNWPAWNRRSHVVRVVLHCTHVHYIIVLYLVQNISTTSTQLKYSYVYIKHNCIMVMCSVKALAELESRQSGEWNHHTSSRLNRLFFMFMHCIVWNFCEHAHIGASVASGQQHLGATRACWIFWLMM